MELDKHAIAVMKDEEIFSDLPRTILHVSSPWQLLQPLQLLLQGNPPQRLLEQLCLFSEIVCLLSLGE